jgi:signal transduction histidine kinase
MHHLWLTFDCLKLERGFLDSQNKSSYSLAIILWCVCWSFVLVVHILNSDNTVTAPVIPALTANVAVCVCMCIADRVPVLKSTAIRCQYFSFAIQITANLQCYNLHFAAATLMDPRQFFETSGSPHEQALVNMFYASEFRGAAFLFMVVFVGSSILPVTFMMRCFLLLLGSGLIHNVGACYAEAVAEFTTASRYNQIVRSQVLVSFSLMAMLLGYSSWVTERTARKAYLSRQREATLQRELLVEKEEKAKVETTVNSYLCHEVRNPFNGVVGSAELMRAMLEECEESQILLHRPRKSKSKSKSTIPIPIPKCDCCRRLDPLLTNIETSAKHITTLLDNMLDLAKIESGLMVLRSDHIDLVSLLRDLEIILTPLKAPGVELLTSCSEPKMEIIGDATRWKQVLLNLAANALR